MIPTKEIDPYSNVKFGGANKVKKPLYERILEKIIPKKYLKFETPETRRYRANSLAFESLLPSMKEFGLVSKI